LPIMELLTQPPRKEGLTMKRMLAKCLWITSSLVLLYMSPLAAQADVTNADQAIARAAKFFKDVGWKLEAKPRGEPKAKFLAPEGKPGRWKVCAGQLKVQLEVEVASQTGKILSAFRREETGKRTQDIVKITETLANQRAAEYLRAAGISLDDKKLERSALSESGIMIWEIKYRRMYKGFPFHEDGLGMSLDLLDGSLIGFGDSCGSPLPDTTDVKLEKDLAVQAARDYLAEFGLTAGNLTSADLKIVQFYDLWEYYEVGGYPPETTSSRLAWDVRFDAPWEGTAVFVDAENGSILGGGMTRTLPKSKVNMPALTEIDTVIVGLADKWSEAIRLSGKSGDGQTLIESIHSLRKAGMPDCKLPITLKFEGKKRSYTFGYSPTAHRLTVLEKKYKDKTIKGELDWETSKEFEDLVAKYAGT